jgi:hypothetical protein
VGRRGVLVTAIVICVTRVAFADPDYRPQDRWFFGLYGGAANTSKEDPAMPDIGAAGPSFGYESSFWPDDFFGFGMNVELADLPRGAGVPDAVMVDMGTPLLLAVPLRYIQVYGGGWVGLRNTFYDHESESVDFALHPIAGVNLYVGRNLRLFAQWQGLDYLRPAEVGGDGQGSMIVSGLRWSPDAFHKLRVASKFQTVWLTTLFTVTTWAVTSAIVGIGPTDQGAM